MSDNFGRRKTMLILFSGLVIGYSVFSEITAGWPVALALLAIMTCSFFGQAASGAVFAMVPLVQRRMTGQIAGMAGAYGNVGAVAFLTIFSFVSAQTFFLVIGGTAFVSLGALLFLEEPEGHMAEVLPDGTVALIEVA